MSISVGMGVDESLSNGPGPACAQRVSTGDPGGLGRMLAWLILAAAYGSTLLIARLLSSRAARSRGRKVGWTATSIDGSGPCGRGGRILATGTFYNRGWFLSHALPLGACGAREVVFVADEPQPAPPGVRLVCPPRWAARILSRAGAKLVWMLREGLRERPDLCMGYHLFPGGLSALIAGRILGCAACYQMTGGPAEVIGGGAGCENPVLWRLARPSPLLERLVVAVLREFELVVGRGSRAKRFLHEHGLNGSVRVITGSITVPPRAPGWADRPIDLIFVGRLTRIKQPEQFVRVVAEVSRHLPEVRAVMVGNGPSLATLRRQAKELGIERNIEFLGQRNDVTELLCRSKVFVLTSRSEGMSIAMAEAMGCGAPAVVADVGELGDLVHGGVNGWLIAPDDVEAYADRATRLLLNPRVWAEFSAAARRAAAETASVERVAGRWRECLVRLRPFRAEESSACIQKAKMPAPPEAEPLERAFGCG